MAYLFLDENSPEDREYCSNYIYFDEKEPGALKKMMQKLKSGKKDKGYEFLCDGSDCPLRFA